MFEEAKKLIALGWCVLPCSGKRKNPYPSWKEYQNKKATIEEWEKWSNDIDITGIALITGEISGIVVVDFDDRAKSEGFMSEIVSETRSGGLHFFYKYSEKLRNTVRVDGSPVDFRGDGGLVIIPPSVACDSKGKNPGQYTWMLPPTEESIKHLEELPEDFSRLLKSSKTLVNSGDWTEVSPSAREVEGAEEGERNDKLFRYCCYLKSKGLSRKEVSSLAKTMNDTFHPPLPTTEIFQIIDSAFTYKDDQDNKPKISVVDYNNLTDKEISAFAPVEKIDIGIPELDRVFNWPTGFYLICGISNVGKGFLFDQIAYWFYKSKGIKSVVFSLEMDEEMIRKRCLQSWSGFTEEDMEKYPISPEAIKTLKDSIRIIPFRDYDLKNQTPQKFREDFEKFYADGYRLFFFDHLLLISGATDNILNQVLIQDWSRTFADISEKHKDCWIMPFTQVRLDRPRSSKKYSKNLITPENMQGAKSIHFACDVFIGLSMAEDGELSTRDFYMNFCKSRKNSQKGMYVKLYFAPDGNFYSSEGEYLMHHKKVLENTRYSEKVKNIPEAKQEELIKLGE
jgi:hypothetical protein